MARARKVPVCLACLGLGAAAAVLAFHVIAQRAERKSLEESYQYKNYTEVEEGLYLGGMLAEPPPGTKAVLNVCETQDPYQAEVHRWQPIPDREPAPSIDWLTQQVEFIHVQRRAGFSVFVHCRAGVSRSGMVTAAYLMWRDGISRDEALAVIRAKRSLVNPNPAFMALLLEWQECIRSLQCWDSPHLKAVCLRPRDVKAKMR